MNDYKKLFYKSQAEIATAIESIEKILDNLKIHMQKCEEDIMSKESEIIQIK